MRDPNDETVKTRLRSELSSAYGGLVPSWRTALSTFVRGLDALDVGVVQPGATEGVAWKHRVVVAAAATCLGLDLLDDVDRLRASGWAVRRVDATSEDDLAQRFDRVVLGDVIEHVDNPVALLRFARRHLRTGGRILVTTPNPNYVFYGLLARRLPFIPNADHALWLSPPMAIALGDRAGLVLDQYFHTLLEGSWSQSIARLVPVYRVRECLSPWHWYVFRSNGGTRV